MPKSVSINVVFLLRLKWITFVVLVDYNKEVVIDNFDLIYDICLYLIDIDLNSRLNLLFHALQDNLGVRYHVYYKMVQVSGQIGQVINRCIWFWKILYILIFLWNKLIFLKKNQYFI